MARTTGDISAWVADSDDIATADTLTWVQSMADGRLVRGVGRGAVVADLDSAWVTSHWLQWVSRTPTTQEAASTPTGRPRTLAIPTTGTILLRTYDKAGTATLTLWGQRIMANQKAITRSTWLATKIDALKAQRAS
jgi:hypothetical protein